MGRVQKRKMRHEMRARKEIVRPHSPKVVPNVTPEIYPYTLLGDLHFTARYVEVFMRP